MEVLESQAAWLSDFEVLQHLQERKEEREKLARTSVPAAENVQTIEFETAQYLSESSVGLHMSARKMESLLEYLKDIKLTKAEKLQILNLLPKTEVEFYLIVEECEERFDADQVRQILEQITGIADRN